MAYSSVISGGYPNRTSSFIVVGNNGEKEVTPIVQLVLKAIQNAGGVKPPSEASPSRPTQAAARPLDSPEQLTPYDVSLEAATHAGRKAVRVLNKPPLGPFTMAIVQGTDFQDGTIDVDVAGEAAARGAGGGRRVLWGVFWCWPTPGGG